MMNRVYSITEARHKLGDLINQVRFGRNPIALGKNRKVEALLVPIPRPGKDIPITELNAKGGAFKFLASEPDRYSLSDLTKRYV